MPQEKILNMFGKVGTNEFQKGWDIAQPEGYIPMVEDKPITEGNWIAKENGTWGLDTISIRIAEIDAELATLDAKSIRPSRNLAVGIDEESTVDGVLVNDSDAIATIRTRVEVLRIERASLVPPVIPTVLNL